MYSNNHYWDYNGKLKKDLYFGVPAISGSTTNISPSPASTGILTGKLSL